MKDERRPICEVVAESIERLIIDGATQGRSATSLGTSTV